MAGRPRKPVDKSEFIQLALAGKGTAEIGKALGMSKPTADRRWDEWQDEIREARGAALLAASTEAAEEGATIPPGATLDQIDEWLLHARQKVKEASTLGDADAHLSYMRLVISLLEARRKAEPEKTPDPNENPDYVAAAVRVRERWHKLAESLVRVTNSPLAETLARMAKR